MSGLDIMKIKKAVAKDSQPPYNLVKKSTDISVSDGYRKQGK